MLMSIFSYLKSAYPLIQFDRADEAKLEFAVLPFLEDYIKSHLRSVLNSEYTIRSGPRLNDGHFVFEVFKKK